MKTLQSILNSPERRLSAEEMRNLKGGETTRCACTFTSGDVSVTRNISGNGSCNDAVVAYDEIYSEMWDSIECETL